jgi:diacylglycerol kinase (ATP)
MTRELPLWIKEFGNRATVFVNPFAGGGRGLGELPRIKAAFESSGLDTIVEETPSAEILQRSSLAALNQGRRALFGMGGDGTLQALVNATQGADVMLGILPSGGGNDFAAALNFRGGPASTANLLLHGKVRPVDLVRATTADGTVRLYVGGGGVGLDADAARFASGAYRSFPGRSRYIASALRAWLSYRAIGESESVESRVLLAGVLNTPTYGAGLRLAPDADISDGMMNCVLIESLNFLQVLRVLPHLMASGKLCTSRITRWNVKRLRLRTDRPAFFHGDGEILGPTPVDLEVVPQALKILAPA